VDNLRQCVAESSVGVSQFVLNPLASAEAALTPTEREMGALVCDIGGGTTDMAIFVEGDVQHTSVLGVGGNHVTSDIAHGLRLPFSQAEEIKLRYGHALPSEVDPTETFAVKALGSTEAIEINRHEMSEIIEARMEEVFTLLHEELGRTAYPELLPAGVVLTGGSSALKGLPELASRVLGMPVRVGQPEKLTGMVDKLQSPAFATSVGLLKWAVLMNEVAPDMPSKNGNAGDKGINWKEWLGRLLP